MNRLYLIVSCVLLYITSSAALAFERPWQKIAVEDTIDMINDAGQPQTISPSCAFDTITDPATGLTLPNDFHFFFKPGNPEKLMIFFNGGGACWDDATCISSLALSSVPDGRPTYNPTIHQENTPAETGGIFKSRPGNAFANWTQVFIPYCTGDIHVGSNDSLYVDLTGSLTQVPGAPVVVKHRGFDNFLAVREWLKQYYANSSHMPQKVLVTGSSAGGYGATLNFPYVKNAFPDSQMALFSDASAGVLSDGFVDAIFTTGQSWMVENTLDPIFSQFLGLYQAPTLNQDMMTILGSVYPDSRFAQYSTEYDSVQVLFLKISKMIDAGVLNPFEWALTPEDYLLFEEFYLRMIASYQVLDATLPNYQFYVGEGSVHTVLTDIFSEDGSSPFFEEKVGHVRFKNWLTKFAEARRIKKYSVMPD